MIYDVAVIGGGVVGCSIFNKLVRLGQSTILIEKGSDVAVGTTKANSGIVHAGFDATPNSLKAKLNVKGARLFPKLCRELDVPYIQNGALVIGNDMSVVQELYNRGITNGVEGLEILDRDALIARLPIIQDDITCGLYASTSAIVSPYKFAIALAEEGVINGGEVFFNFDIQSASKKDGVFVLVCGDKSISARKLVLAVGGEHNSLAKILGSSQYDIFYRRGEYYLLDKGSMDIGGYTIFPLPTKSSKGVLVSATVDGNIIVGPTSTLADTNETMTTRSGLEEIAEKSNAMLKGVNLRKNIRVFSGVRTLVDKDFVIEKDVYDENIINVTGICSPGLTASPAIAEYVVELLGVSGAEKTMKRRPQYPSISGKSIEDINKLIHKDSRYGKIVCRCEGVSEMEIINAIHSPLKPISLDGIKRRTRAGMGRCQSGFCFLKVMEIIARERGMSIDDVLKENKDSRIIVGDIE